MSVLITGVDMPMEDFILSVDIFPDGTVADHWTCSIKGARAEQLPPHGDLIDRSELLENSKANGMYPHWIDTMDIKRMPTIVPAERSSDE